jgi:guanine nucleotide-binding protein G(I)/G(S)/G(T) subunit beta-1
MSSGNAIGTGSDDSTARIFDLRSCGPVNIFADARILCGVTDISFSATGRLLFAAYEEPYVVGWETVVRDGTYHELRGHRSRVSSCKVNQAGEALLTASWDKELAVWA